MNIEQLKQIDITQDKVLKITKSGFKIFVNNDLEKASTNLIVEDAQVSRGILYHYFKDKQELFDFLLYFSAKKIFDNMKEAIDWSNTDYFIRLRQSLASKVETIIEFPYLYDFGKKYIAFYPKSISEDLMPGFQHRFYHENLDFTNVREDIDVEMMKKTVIFALSELTRSVFHDIEAASEEMAGEELLKGSMKEIDRYLAFFRSAFYKS